MIQESPERIRTNAAKCRELADTSITPAARNILADLAEDYERKAILLEHRERQRGGRSPFRWPLR